MRQQHIFDDGAKTQLFSGMSFGQTGTVLIENLAKQNCV